MQSKNSFMSSESSMSMALVRKSAISQTENLKTKGFDLSPWLLALEEEIQPVRKWTWDYCTSPGLGASPSPDPLWLGQKPDRMRSHPSRRQPCLQLSSPLLWGWGSQRAGSCSGSSRVLFSPHGLQEGGDSCDKTLQLGLLWVGWGLRVRLSQFLSLFAVKIRSKPILLKFAKLLLHIIPFTSWSKCAFDQNLSFYTSSSGCDMSRS